ncbi:MAG: head-tail adaptor protein [Pirellulales bacterium]
MAVELNIQDDFADVLDGVEPITLKRRDSAATIAVATAWRFSSRTAETEAGGGHVAQHDVVWQFPWDEANEPPRLGDTLIDGAENCFTILAVEQLRAASRLRCETRNLSLVYELNDRVEVQQAVWEDTGGGPEIVGWTTIRAALAARIQPERLEVDNESSPATATATYRIILGEQIELGADWRFVDPLGNIYQLVEYIQGDRIDALPVATVVKQPAD